VVDRVALGHAPRVRCAAVKLVSWNVNSLNARMPRVLELLEAHRPDVALLQETRVEPDAFPGLDFEAAGYRTVHHSAGRWAGVAIAAREDPGEVCVGLAGEPAVDEARWIEATVDGLRVVSVYVPNGREVDSTFYEDKLRFLEAAAERVRALTGEPLVVAGDFNVCPADLDVYDPAAFVGSTHVTPAERGRFAALLDAGTVDAFRELHPDEPGFTWWDYRQGHFHRKMGLRIDAFLLSAPLAWQLEECGIDRSFRKGAKPSDHAPLLCELSGSH
jgi:exodeoxyribonuclease III